MAFGDLFRINTNSQSMQVRKQLNLINKQIGLTQLRLATGRRILRAEDDAAGFSIAAKVTARIAGMEQALRNVSDAKSVLDIAEQSMNSVLDILTMMKVKAVQAANDTYGTEERGFIQNQVNALVGELDSLVDQTTFQGRNLLDGTYQASFQAGANVSDVLSVSINTGIANNGFRSAALQLDSSTLDFSSSDNARASLVTIDAAITSVVSTVNRLGVDQMRLSIREQTISNSIISNQSVKSRIVDADFAKEASELLRLQILQQTLVFSLLQANLAPRAVLSLL